MNEGQKLDRLVGRPTSEPVVKTQINITESDPVCQAVAGEFERSSDMTFPVHLTDVGNSQLLIRAYGATLRYCFPWSAWLIWDGTRWKKDDTGLIYRRAKETVRLMYVGAAGVNGDAVIDQDQAKHAMRSESVRALNAMIDLARSEPNIPVLPGDLDKNPFQLNVLNGTLDLKTGELKYHNKRDLITKVVPVAYDSYAKAPLWEKFLDRIMAGNTDLIDFLQRAVGYSLTGDTSEQAVFVLHGPHDNGKTTFVETIRAMAGDYGLPTPIETLLARKGPAISNDIADLRGSRLVTTSEVDQGRRLAEAKIKHLTGAGMVKVRFLYSEFFSFKPECKIWLDTNHKPVIKGTDPAIWDRIKLVPFSVIIPEPEQDKHLKDKLKEELPGILAWAVKGCLAWQKNGLGIPKEVKEATASYRGEMDILGAFLKDRCVVNPTSQVTSKALSEAYLGWCEGNGEKHIGKRAFGMQLAERGFNSYRGTHGIRTWIGLGLTDSGGEFLRHQGGE